MTSRFVVRRLLQVPFSVLVILGVTFTLVYFVPGDPARLVAGEVASDEEIRQIREDYGFDRPLLSQFASYVGRVLRGDLGQSYDQGRSVASIIRDHARPTLLLTGTALLVSTVGGLFLALLAVRKPFGWRDRIINTSLLIVYALPAFWLAQLAIIWLVLKLGIFPPEGYAEFGTGAPTGLAHWADVAHHLMLPALLLALAELAAVTRVVRSGLLTELDQAYVRTAQAKGVGPDEVLSRHALRNALLPMITLIGARVGFLLSGAAIIETIFSWPGLGSLTVVAVENTDRPLVLGLVLMTSFTIVAANLLTDLVYAWSDPRIGYD